MHSLQTFKRIWTIFRTPINYSGYVDPTAGEVTTDTVLDAEGWTLPSRMGVVDAVHTCKKSLAGMLLLTVVLFAGYIIPWSPFWLILAIIGFWVYMLDKNADYLKSVYNSALTINANTRDNIKNNTANPPHQPGTWGEDEDSEIVDSFIANINKKLKE